MERRLLGEAEEQQKIIISAGSAFADRSGQFLFYLCPP
jgi:hypothetical protein